MARSLLNVTVQDESGDVQKGALVTVYASDGTTLFQPSMYAAVSGGTALANPLKTDNLGRLRVYADTPADVVLSSGGVTFLASFGPSASEVSRLLTILTATGDMAYRDSTGALARLAVGSNGQYLGAVGGLPGYLTSPYVGKNLLFNGMGRTNLLGLYGASLPTTDNAEAISHWRVLMENANGFTVSQETSNLPVPGPGYGMKYTVGSGNNGKGGTCQIIPYSRSRRCAGDVVSLQGKIYATAGIANMRMAPIQWAGTADNGGTAFADPVTTWGADGTNPTLSGSWTFPVAPTNLGVTAAWQATPFKVENVPILSTTNNLGVVVWCDDRTTTQTTDYFIATDLQLERAASCSTFEEADPRLEMMDALAFYERMYPSMLARVNNTEFLGYYQPYVVPKWRAPTSTKVGTFTVSSCGQPSFNARVAGVSNLFGLEIQATASATAQVFFVPADTTTYFEIDARI